MDKQKYIPISCSFYDELEALATLRRRCTIRYLDETDTLREEEALIVDLSIKNKVEYLHTDTKLSIRLDRLVSVDGKDPGNYC